MVKRRVLSADFINIPERKPDPYQSQIDPISPQCAPESSSRWRPVWFAVYRWSGGKLMNLVRHYRVLMSPQASILSLLREAEKQARTSYPDVTAAVLRVYLRLHGELPVDELEFNIFEIGDHLGSDSRNPLIIVMPPKLDLPADSLLVSQRSIYTTCSEPFFVDLMMAEEVGNWLNFMHPIPDGIRLDRLYIRECYRKILSMICCTSPVKKTIITGTPGIGKSICLFYLLWKLLNRKKRVIFVWEPYSLFFDGKGGIFSTRPFYVPRLGEMDPSDPDRQLWTEDTYCLFDSRETPTQLTGVPYNQCPFVYSRSLRNDAANELEKCDPNMIVKTLYMPRWSFEEIENVSVLFPNACEWKGRLEIVGPIPRLVFVAGGTIASAIDLVKRAAENSDMIDLIYEVGKRDGLLRKSVVHRAVHYISEEPYETFTLSFASDFAMKTCFEVHKKLIRKRWDETFSA